MTKVESNKPLSRLARSLKLSTWEDLVKHVQSLPYGRNSNRSDFSLVLKEKRGTCSSKHALLFSIALENDFNDVQQMLGIYKMTEKNTPGVGDTQLSPEIDYIPEAHSYLKIGDQYFDYTNEQSSYDRIKADVLVEFPIQPIDVVGNKIKLHQDFLRQWIAEQKLELNLEEVWKKREVCITKLSSSRL